MSRNAERAIVLGVMGIITIQCLPYGTLRALVGLVTTTLMLLTIVEDGD
jgi:hypothetical protein